MKKIALILVFALVLSFCGTAAHAATPPKPSASPEPAEAETLPIPGCYHLYLIKIAGKESKPSEFSLSSEFTLKEDGTGSMLMNGQEVRLPKWEEADGKLTLYNEKGDPLACEVRDGIVTLEMAPDYYWYYAHEGTGITDADDGRQYESKLYALLQGIDAEKGAHLRYEAHADYMDSTSVFDVHAKDGVFFSDRVTKVKGAEGRKGTFFKDGTTYVLNPDKKTGSVATTIGGSIISGNVLMLDELYQLIYTMARRGDWLEEERELDGVKYAAEVFPETAYKPETVFFYDKDGALVHVLEGAPLLAKDMGETLYTVRAIDDKVDAALLDISAYTITK